MRLSASSLLKQLDELRHRYGTDAAPRRLEILRELGGGPWVRSRRSSASTSSSVFSAPTPTISKS